MTFDWEYDILNDKLKINKYKTRFMVKFFDFNRYEVRLGKNYGSGIFTLLSVSVRRF
jgi:hypothetical protein